MWPVSFCKKTGAELRFWHWFMILQWVKHEMLLCKIERETSKRTSNYLQIGILRFFNHGVVLLCCLCCLIWGPECFLRRTEQQVQPSHPEITKTVCFDYNFSWNWLTYGSRFPTAVLSFLVSILSSTCRVRCISEQNLVLSRLLSHFGLSFA